MPVSNLIIDVIEKVYDIKMNEILKEQYSKALSRFPDDVLSAGMESIAVNYQSNFKPMPGIVAKFCFENQLEMMPAKSEGRDAYQDAKNLVKSRKQHLRKHEAYKHITPGNVRARIELSRLIDDRAMIAAQAICGCYATGYGNESFGYNTWGGLCKNIKSDLAAIRDEALKTSLIDPFVPREAVDYFNSLEDFDGLDVPQVAANALSSKREELLEMYRL